MRHSPGTGNVFKLKLYHILLRLWESRWLQSNNDQFSNKQTDNFTNRKYRIELSSQSYSYRRLNIWYESGAGWELIAKVSSTKMQFYVHFRFSLESLLNHPSRFAELVNYSPGIRLKIQKSYFGERTKVVNKISIKVENVINTNWNILYNCHCSIWTNKVELKSWTQHFRFNFPTLLIFICSNTKPSSVNALWLTNRLQASNSNEQFHFKVEAFFMKKKTTPVQIMKWLC